MTMLLDGCVGQGFTLTVFILIDNKWSLYEIHLVQPGKGKNNKSNSTVV